MRSLNHIELKRAESKQTELSQAELSRTVATGGAISPRSLRRTRRSAQLLIVALLLSSTVLVGTGCRKKAEDFTELTGQPARKMFNDAENLLAARKLNPAIKLFQQIDLRYTGEERTELEPLVRLRMADATFYQSTNISLIDARSLYLDFVTLFGDHPLAPYAQFQAGICSLKQASHPAKDQSQTYRAISDFQEVRVRFPNSRYATAALGQVREAESILAEHEYIVGRFYMKKSAWDAAIDRFQYLLERYPDYLEMDKIYFQLARTLLEQENGVEAGIYLDKLLQDFPASDYRKQAISLAKSESLQVSGTQSTRP